MEIYVVIDVEMCKVQKCYSWKNYRYANEIIQIGAVMMNKEFQQISEFSSYVKPQYGKIDYFIEHLTGISNKDIRRAPDLEEVLRRMKEWIGEKEVLFYSWSETDYFQICGEIRAKGYDENELSSFLNADNWKDYQKVMKDRLDSARVLSLADALSITDISPEGPAHDGLADAYNTARMIAKVELHPEYKFSVESAREEKHSPLSVSMGSLLQGLQLEIA